MQRGQEAGSRIKMKIRKTGQCVKCSEPLLMKTDVLVNKSWCICITAHIMVWRGFYGTNMTIMICLRTHQLVRLHKVVNWAAPSADSRAELLWTTTRVGGAKMPQSSSLLCDLDYPINLNVCSALLIKKTANQQLWLISAGMIPGWRAVLTNAATLHWIKAPE